MKYVTSIKCNFLAFSLMLCFTANAKTVALVNSVKGNVFVVVDGKTGSVRPGDMLTEFSEVFTEVGAQITLTDYHDHQFHLSGQGQMKIMNNRVELNRGYLWIQSKNKGRDFSASTANSVVSFYEGESILSFDSSTGKTQLLVINGKFFFNNINEKSLNTKVHSGHFSFIDDNYARGIPRKPTKIGYNSYKKVVSLFHEVDPMPEFGNPFPVKKSGPPKREIASVLPKPRKRVVVKPFKSRKTKVNIFKPGKIVLLKSSSRRPSSFDPTNLYQEKIDKYWNKPRPFSPSYGKKSNVKVRFFGEKKDVPVKLNDFDTTKRSSNVKRKPSSIQAWVKKEPKIHGIKKDAFEGSLIDEYKQQMRHSQEVNELINELRNFDNDFDQNY